MQKYIVKIFIFKINSKNRLSKRENPNDYFIFYNSTFKSFCNDTIQFSKTTTSKIRTLSRNKYPRNLQRRFTSDYNFYSNLIPLEQYW